MIDTKPIIFVLVLVLLCGGSFYLAEEAVKSHLSYTEDYFRNARGDQLYKQSKRFRVAKDDQGQHQQTKIEARLLSSADDLP